MDRIKTVAHKATDTYAVTNNYHLGKAVVNTLEIASILNAKPVAAPASLVENYPELKKFTELLERALPS